MSSAMSFYHTILNNFIIGMDEKNHTKKKIITRSQHLSRKSKSLAPLLVFVEISYLENFFLNTCFSPYSPV